MSKQYIVNRHTTPSTPALDEVPNEKIRVFANETAIDAALSSLDEDEIVATEDGAAYSPEDYEDDYSTTETAIGKQWIDGKMIYRKVVVVNQAAPSSISLGISNVDELIDLRIKCIFTSSTPSNNEVAFYSSNSGGRNGGNPYYFTDKTTLGKISSDWTGYVYWVVVEYTKN